MIDPTRRFANRVENYIRYRPRYPTAILQTLAQECGLAASHVVADIGSGTGILSELFLANGNRVFGVEPNPEMRAAGERLLRHHAHFTSLDGRAEATTLPDRAVDFITAGQAFHWFDRTQARREFARILQPTGWVVLIWNKRLTDASPFLRAYEDLLRKYGTDYASVDHRRVDGAAVAEFFAPGKVTLREFPNQQHLDLAGVKGRLLSSSYAPAPGQPGCEPMLDELAAIFAQSQTNGHVAFDYITQMYFGRLPASWP